VSAIVFWIGFALVFAGAPIASPANLLDLLMKDGPRKDFARQVGTGAMMIGGALVLLAWLAF